MEKKINLKHIELKENEEVLCAVKMVGTGAIGEVAIVYNAKTRLYDVRRWIRIHGCKERYHFESFPTEDVREAMGLYKEDYVPHVVNICS